MVENLPVFCMEAIRSRLQAWMEPDLLLLNRAKLREGCVLSSNFRALVFLKLIYSQHLFDINSKT